MFAHSAAAATDPSVQYAQPVQSVHATVLPNDPEYTNGNLYGLNGTYGVNAPGAWSVTTGSPATVTIASLDTGVEYDHPDLIAMLRRVIDAGNRHHIPAGCWFGQPEQALLTIRQGARLVVYSNDGLMLKNAVAARMSATNRIT